MPVLQGFRPLDGESISKLFRLPAQQVQVSSARFRPLDGESISKREVLLTYSFL